jgi:hypothetical protein
MKKLILKLRKKLFDISFNGMKKSRNTIFLSLFHILCLKLNSIYVKEN